MAEGLQVTLLNRRTTHTGRQAVEAVQASRRRAAGRTVSTIETGTSGRSAEDRQAIRMMTPVTTAAVTPDEETRAEAETPECAT